MKHQQCLYFHGNRLIVVSFPSTYADNFCGFSSSSREREDRKAIKKEDFILDHLKDQTIYRLPGSVNGQQFIIQNCEVNLNDDLIR